MESLFTLAKTGGSNVNHPFLGGPSNENMIPNKDDQKDITFLPVAVLQIKIA